MSLVALSLGLWTATGQNIDYNISLILLWITKVRRNFQTIQEKMRGEGTYVCTLDTETLEKAKNELNEDPKERASHIETLRKWCKEQPHLNSRTG